MTARLAETDRQRIGCAGLLPLSDVDGLALLDAALGAGPAVLPPFRVDPPVLAASAQTAGSLPAVLRDLVPAARPQPVAAAVPVPIFTGAPGVPTAERSAIRRRSCGPPSVVCRRARMVAGIVMTIAFLGW
jgi:hypothetical protein